MKSKIKKMEKLNKRIKNNPNDAEAYFERARLQDNKQKAIDDLTESIKINPETPKYYFYRAVNYVKVEKKDEAFEDFIIALEQEPESDEIFSLFLGFLSSKYRDKIDNKHIIKILSKAIYLKPKFLLRIAIRGTFYSYCHKYKKAINDFTEAIELIPKDQFENHPKIQILLTSRAENYIRLKKYKKALDDYDLLINIQNDSAENYSNRAELFMKMDNYENALKDIDKALKINPKEGKYFIQKGDFYRKIEKYDESIKNYSEAIEIEPSSAKNFSKRAKLYNKMERYEDALNDYNKAIEIEPNSTINFLYRAELYYKMERYEDALNDYNKAIELDNRCRLDEDYTDILIGAAYEYFKQHKYNKMYKYLIKLEREDTDFSGVDSTSKKFGKMLDYYEEIKDYEKLIVLYKKCEVTPNGCLAAEEINRIFRKQKKKDIAHARVEERNKIIADLSHSIKNMLGTVIDPLENLKEENEVRPNIINNAIRGANLIRQIVNAMNLSFKGSFEDFVYDAEHNKGHDAVSFETMILESLKHSVSNMFDSKYFGNFMRNYFPQKEIFQEANTAWKRISDSEEVEDIETFANKYFFKTEFDLDSANDFVLGNEKGSAIKLQILFQEIIFNAVKYTGFVDKKNRLLKIKFSHSSEKISFKVENSYTPSEKTKTTGLGHVVIENFAKLLRSKPQINKSKTRFSLLIKFSNFWDNRDELFEVVKKMEKKL